MEGGRGVGGTRSVGEFLSRRSAPETSCQGVCRAVGGGGCQGVVFSKIRISHVAVHSFMPLYFHTVRTTDNIDIIQSGLDGPDSVRISEVPD